MPLVDLYNKHYSNLEEAVSYSSWKKHVETNWENILIEQSENPENIKIYNGL